MNRVILHSDLNSFYASVECLYRPELRELPVAVCGDVEARHGIVLARNQIAKNFGVATAEPLWQAKQKCPRIVFVPPNFERYMRFSRMTREIYDDYTPYVEPFGLDECWLDMSGSTHLFGDGKVIADNIRNRIKKELGISVSVGVSFNKIFAKLGSDLRKPDYTTVISEKNFKEIVWKLPASELLYVGKSTNEKLRHYGIKTIGEIANIEQKYLTQILGKMGTMLWLFANGKDFSAVSETKHTHDDNSVKSIGNSTTTPRDLIDDEDVKITLYMLSESVAARLREKQFKARTVQLHIRNSTMDSYERQAKFDFPVCTAVEFAEKSFELYKKHHPKGIPLRNIGVRATDLIKDIAQIPLFSENPKYDRTEKLEFVMDKIKSRFGNYSIQRALMLLDNDISHHTPKDDHKIFPVSYF